MADNRPKMDAGALAKVALKDVAEPVEKNDSLNRASMLNSINRQGVIAMPSEHAPKSDAVARATVLHSISRQGVIAVPSEFAPKENNSALNRAAMLNSIGRQGVIAVPEGHAPDTSLTADKLKELQVAAAEEKKEVAAFAASVAAKQAEFQAKCDELAKERDCLRVTFSAVQSIPPVMMVVASTDKALIGQNPSPGEALAAQSGKTISMEDGDHLDIATPLRGPSGQIVAICGVQLLKTDKKADAIAQALAALLPQ